MAVCHPTVSVDEFAMHSYVTRSRESIRLRCGLEYLGVSEFKESSLCVLCGEMLHLPTTKYLSILALWYPLSTAPLHLHLRPTHKSQPPIEDQFAFNSWQGNNSRKYTRTKESPKKKHDYIGKNSLTAKEKHSDNKGKNPQRHETSDCAAPVF